MRLRRRRREYLPADYDDLEKHLHCKTCGAFIYRYRSDEAEPFKCEACKQKDSYEASE